MLTARTNWIGGWWRWPSANAEKLNKYKQTQSFCWHVWAQHYTFHLYFKIRSLLSCWNDSNWDKENYYVQFQNFSPQSIVPTPNLWTKGKSQIHRCFHADDQNELKMMKTKALRARREAEQIQMLTCVGTTLHLESLFQRSFAICHGALHDAPVITIWSCIWVLLSHSKESRGLGVTDFSQPTLAWCSPLQSREFYRRTGRATFWSLAPSFSQTPGGRDNKKYMIASKV